MHVYFAGQVAKRRWDGGYMMCPQAKALTGHDSK